MCLCGHEHGAEHEAGTVKQLFSGCHVSIFSWFKFPSPFTVGMPVILLWWSVNIFVDQFSKPVLDSIISLCHCILLSVRIFDWPWGHEWAWSIGMGAWSHDSEAIFFWLSCVNFFVPIAIYFEDASYFFVVVCEFFCWTIFKTISGLNNQLCYCTSLWV